MLLEKTVKSVFDNKEFAMEKNRRILHIDETLERFGGDRNLYMELLEEFTTSYKTVQKALYLYLKAKKIQRAKTRAS